LRDRDNHIHRAPREGQGIGNSRRGCPKRANVG
jgi:hypothetical protein